MNKIIQAIEVLLSVCDGAATKDGAGFNGCDSGYARSLFKQYQESKQLSRKQLSSAYTMLRKYRKQLEALGVPFEEIEIPSSEPVKEQIIEINWKLFEELTWDTKEIQTQEKVFDMFYTNMPTWFWDIWKEHKEDIKSKGYSISKFNEKWQLNKWVLKKDTDLVKKERIEKVDLKYEQLLKDYQREHTKTLIKALLNHNAALDTSDTGVGKTYTSSAIAKELGMFPIVVTPKSVIYSFKKVLSDHFNLEGYVNNYEQYKTGNTPYVEVIPKSKKKKGFVWKVPDNALIIFDEAHRAKNHSTQNAELVIQAKKQGIPIIFMSATIADNPLQLWAVGFALDLFTSKAKFFDWIFKHDCYQTNYRGYTFNGSKQALQQISEQIYPEKGSRISIKDLGDKFPENKTMAQCCDMSEYQKIQTIYLEMKKELKELDKKEKKITKHHLAIRQKAHQKIELLKVPTLVEMTQDALEEGKSVVIFVNYNQTAQALSDKLQTNSIIWGKNLNHERDQIIESFQNNQEKIIICNIRAGGVGISLHDITGEAPRLALVTPSLSPQDMRQALGRVHRAGGQSKSIQKILFCANTIEEDVYLSVKKKLERIDNLNCVDFEDFDELYVS